MTIDVVLDGPRLKLWPRVLSSVSRVLGRMMMLFVAALAVFLLPPLGFIAASEVYKAEMPPAVMDHLALFLWESGDHGHWMPSRPDAGTGRRMARYLRPYRYAGPYMGEDG
jgi:hypothetical protein